VSEVPTWLIISVALLLLVAPLLPLVVAVLFAPDFWSRNIPLRERAGLAFRDFGLALFVAFLAASYLFHWDVNPVLVFSLTVVAYLSISVPSAVWLWLFFKGHYR
jgi:hypothetical protein